MAEVAVAAEQVAEQEVAVDPLTLQLQPLLGFPLSPLSHRIILQLE